MPRPWPTPKSPQRSRRAPESASRAPLLVAAGGIVAAIGAVLPWEYVSSAAGTVVRGGLETSDALVPAILGIVLVIASVVVRRRAVSPYWRFMLLMSAGPVLAVAIFDTVELTRAIAAFNAARQDVVASIGPGLIIVGLGAILAIIGIVRLPRAESGASTPAARHRGALADRRDVSASDG